MCYAPICGSRTCFSEESPWWALQGGASWSAPRFGSTCPHGNLGDIFMLPNSLSSSCSYHQTQIIYFCTFSCLFYFLNFHVDAILCPPLLTLETRSRSHLFDTMSSHDHLHVLGLCSCSKGNNQDVVSLSSFPCPPVSQTGEGTQKAGAFLSVLETAQ